jgi:hypothetical protein
MTIDAASDAKLTKLTTGGPKNDILQGGTVAEKEPPDHPARRP